jgi:hypothetical protein
MRRILLAFALSASAATAASAQGVYVEQHGWGGDRGFERRWDHDRGDHRGWDRAMRRGYREVDTTGSVGCRQITVRKQDEWGNTVVKRIQRCD